MGKIVLEGMEFFSYHGCFSEEQVIGTRFIVTLELDTDTGLAETTDKLSDTINYQEVYKIVGHEMERPSFLIEHVARRILDALRQAFPSVRHMRITLSKINPPLGGKVDRVTCVLEL